jgi:hypothetical protein
MSNRKKHIHINEEKKLNFLLKAGLVANGLYLAAIMLLLIVILRTTVATLSQLR